MYQLYKSSSFSSGVLPSLSAGTLFTFAVSCLSYSARLAHKHSSVATSSKAKQPGEEEAAAAAESEEQTDIAQRAPCLRPGALRAARLCSMTGLCSRTKVNIVNTNMRCPTCLLDHLEDDKPLTFFPAIPIENTVRLMHHHPYSCRLDPLFRPTCSPAANLVTRLT